MTKKKRTKSLSELSQLILDVDNRYASSSTLELYKRACYTNWNLTIFPLNKWSSICLSRGSHFMSTERKLASSHQHRQSAASITIPEICVAADLTSTNPKEINQINLSNSTLLFTIWTSLVSIQMNKLTWMPQ